MNDNKMCNAHPNRDLFLEELIQHPLACLHRRNPSPDESENNANHGNISVASGLTCDSASSLDIDDIQNHDLPIMIESSASEMLAFSNSGLGFHVQSDLRWGCDLTMAQRYCNDTGETSHRKHR
jgi:hypothetical protein